MGQHHPATSLAVLAGVGAIALVVVARRRSALSLALGLGFVALYGGAAGIYAMKKFVDGAGFPTLSYATQAWVDGKVGSGARVAIRSDRAIDGGSAAIFREVRLFNRSSDLRPDLDLAGIANPATGQVRGDVPRYLVSVPRARPLGLEAHQIASTTYLPQPLVLDEVAQPPRLAWAQQPAPAGTIVVRFFAGPAGRCAVIGFAGAGRFSLRLGARRAAGRLADANAVTQTIALPARRTVDAHLAIRSGGRLVGLGVAPCP